MTRVLAPEPVLTTPAAVPRLRSWDVRSAGPAACRDGFTAAQQEQSIGIGHDGMWYFGDDRRGLLCINHEFGTNQHVFGAERRRNDGIEICRNARIGGRELEQGHRRGAECEARVALGERDDVGQRIPSLRLNALSQHDGDPAGVRKQLPVMPGHLRLRRLRRLSGLGCYVTRAERQMINEKQR